MRQAPCSRSLTKAPKGAFAASGLGVLRMGNLGVANQAVGKGASAVSRQTRGAVAEPWIFARENPTPGNPPPTRVQRVGGLRSCGAASPNPLATVPPCPARPSAFSRAKTPAAGRAKEWGFARENGALAAYIPCPAARCAALDWRSALHLIDRTVDAPGPNFRARKTRAPAVPSTGARAHLGTAMRRERTWPAMHVQRRGTPPRPSYPTLRGRIIFARENAAAAHRYEFAPCADAPGYRCISSTTAEATTAQ